jgi:hypothetical protein
MRLNDDGTSRAAPQGFDLCRRNRRRLSLKANQLYDAREPQNIEPIAPRHLHKYVAGEQRQVNASSPVLPAADRRIQREKRPDLAID